MNINHLSIKAMSKLFKLDKSFIGTDDYMGLEYFWSYEYRHYLRDVNEHTRRRVHKAFLKNNLKINGVSAEHLKIIRKITKLY